MREFIRKVYIFFKSRMFVNETFILYKHINLIEHISPVKIILATNENIKDVLNFQHPRYLKMFRRFLSEGDAGYLGYFNNTCVHRSWVIYKPKTIFLHKFIPKELKENEVFIHMCETATHARGKNIYPYILTKIVKDFSNVKNIYISVNEKNQQSIRGIEKAGFIEIERVNIKVVIGIKKIKTL